MTVLSFTIPGDPGRCRTNARATPIVREGSKRPTMILSADYKAWRELAILLMRREAAKHPDQARVALLRVGPVVVSIAAYWDRKHDNGAAEGLAFADVDAVVKACLDALGMPKLKPKKPGAGIITDDGQVVSALLSKHYDKRNPRIEIEVRTAT